MYNDDYEIYENKTDETKSSTDTRNNDFSIRIYPGYGRIYSGVYGATALYLINEFGDKHLLKTEPSYDDMIALSDAIYKNRSLHAVDSRIRRIEGFTEIQSLLESKNIIDNTGAASLVLQDVWDYFPHNSRDFGWRVKAGISYDYFYASGQQSQKETSTDFEVLHYLYPADHLDTLSDDYQVSDRYFNNHSTMKDMSLGLTFEYSKPFSLKWQLDNEVTASYSLYHKYYSNSYYRYSESSIYSSERKLDYDDSYQLRLRNTLSYIISSRSTVSWQAITQYIHENMKTEWLSSIYTPEYESEVSHHFGLSLFSSMEYRLSIPTTLKTTLSISTTDSGNDYLTYSDDYNALNYTITIGLMHYLY